ALTNCARQSWSKRGFNPVSCISDQLYVLNHEKDAYEVLDALKYQDIIEGRMNI
ncbi:conserved hypothetical protein, partial [Trichinella spiralis]|uniref:hypothetical protein n=1 Tax=Trichinella spiralis TaxID=6334 RepID=UPI0001EFE2BB